SLEFEVVVLAEEADGVVAFLLAQNNANVFLRSQLGIGAGGYAYYADVLSSTSKLLFLDYEVNTTHYKENPTLNNHSGERTGVVEFIAVHYTGNMAKGSTASANANYFVNQSTGSSIHYVTGNDGIFYCYDEKYVAWHAGDGTSNTFEWFATGVMVQESDPETPVVTITENSKFAINGTETTVACPQGYARVWDSALGKMVDGDWIVPTDNKYLTCFGPAVKVVDGQYYIGETWWCNSQVAEGRICSLGGNLNSIGIETACNEGSDLWLTWQKTAQLVADLLIRYDLGVDRVKGHNFFSAKDCPQPMLENDTEIWHEFIELVKAEKEAFTTYKDWTFTCVSNNPEIVDNTGRVIAQPEFDTCVTYTVTCTNGTETKTVTMSSMVPGYYRNLAQGER
ncbi:MAG: N-acetylmuramoyl-L-alanine amidase family protein, partial [Bacilli bacterium]